MNVRFKDYKPTSYTRIHQLFILNNISTLHGETKHDPEVMCNVLRSKPESRLPMIKIQSFDGYHGWDIRNTEETSELQVGAN